MLGDKDRVQAHVAAATDETARGFTALAEGDPATADLHFQSAARDTIAAVCWKLIARGTRGRRTAIMRAIRAVEREY